MQLTGAEICVGGIVLIEAADTRIAEEHTTAAVRLKTMFVRVHNDRVHFFEAVEYPPRVACKVAVKRIGWQTGCAPWTSSSSCWRLQGTGKVPTSGPMAFLLFLIGQSSGAIGVKW